MSLSIHFASDEYLVALGRVTYSVSSLEGGILFDIPHNPHIKNLFDMQELVDKTTGGIAVALKAVLKHNEISDPQTMEWLTLASSQLKEIAKRRNHIIHSRPATSRDGETILYRWSPKKEATFEISIEMMNELVDDIAAMSHNLEPYRYKTETK